MSHPFPSPNVNMKSVKAKVSDLVNCFYTILYLYYLWIANNYHNMCVTTKTIVRQMFQLFVVFALRITIKHFKQPIPNTYSRNRLLNMSEECSGHSFKRDVVHILYFGFMLFYISTISISSF